MCGLWLFVTRTVQPAMWGSTYVLSEFIIQYYSCLAARDHVTVIIGDETKLSPFIIQPNVLSDVYFCDVCLHVVSLPCAEQSDL